MNGEYETSVPIHLDHFSFNNSKTKR